MTRSVGAVSVLQDMIPPEAAIIVALLTQLGDLWFLGALLVILYLARASDRENIVLVGATLIVGVGLYRGLKHVFALPRPDQPLADPELFPGLLGTFYEVTASASSYGFPSGHATTVTIVSLGLAAVLTVSSTRRRFGLAGLIVVGVSLSRVALGVHYLADIVAGIALGGVLVGVIVCGLNRVTEQAASITLFLGVIAAVFYLLASQSAPKSVYTLGLSLGAVGGWQILQIGQTALSAQSDEVTRIQMGICIGALTLLVVAVSTVLVSMSALVVAGIIGLATVLGMALPLADPSSRLRQESSG